MAVTFLPLPSATASAVSIVFSGTGTGAAETAFTPPTGKRWRLVGWQIYGGGATADCIADVTILEAAAIIRVGFTASTITGIFSSSPFMTPLGHIPHESAVDALLKMTITNTKPVSGVLFIQVF